MGLHKEAMDQRTFEKLTMVKADEKQKNLGLLMRLAILYRESDPPPSYNDLKSKLVSEFGPEEFQKNKETISGILQTLDKQKSKEGSVLLSKNPLKTLDGTSNSDFEKVDVSATPLGSSSTPLPDKNADMISSPVESLSEFSKHVFHV